ncbi:MAG: hypothetical protein KDJ19_08600 [Hyphomicrobiaceae bacterium]|nr:hypothetical protein [Hyphomicrobiaceae bacterium]MCC0024300.1 hypothetical protein [Hyphomicrobiaceae bacterium]
MPAPDDQFTELRRYTTTTVDEIGAVEVKFVNVYERDTRPGVKSVLLILPDRELVLASGDVFEIGDKRYRLEAIEPEPSGLFAIVISGPPEQREGPDALPMPPRIELGCALTALQFKSVLTDISQDVLAGLTSEAVPQIAGWMKRQSSSTTKDWTGEEWGPSHDHRWVAAFSAEDASRFAPLEVSLGLEDIRYNPNEEWRYEVRGFWQVGERTAHVGARQDVPDLITSFLGDDNETWVHDLIADVAQKEAARSAPIFFENGINVGDLAAILELSSHPILAYLTPAKMVAPKVASFHDQTGMKDGRERIRAGLFSPSEVERLGKIEARIRNFTLQRGASDADETELNGWWRVGERRLSLQAIAGEDGLVKSAKFVPAAPELNRIIHEAVEALSGKA